MSTKVQAYAAVLLCLCIGALAVAPAATAETIDRPEVEQIVREYILQNPEIVREALVELENRAQRAQAEARSAAIAVEQDALLTSDNDVVLGNPEGDVTLVEFFDFNCGYCKRALPDVQALIAADSQLRVVLKDFPILGPGSVGAAKVVLAVKRQGDEEIARDLHVRLLQLQGQVNEERALSLAQDLGLDVDRIKEDMEDPAIEVLISSNLALAQRLGLTGTPSFIVGDQIIEGAVGEAPLAEAIRSVRQ